MNIVKSRSLVAAATILILATIAIAVAPQQAPGNAPPKDGPPPVRPETRPGGERGGGPSVPGGGAQGRGASISGSMKSINRAAKQLLEQITDSSKMDENLKLINDMQRSAVIAKGLPLPADVLEHGKDDAAKAKMRETFRRDLMKALGLMLDIEGDLLDGKGDAAKVKLDELTKLREKSHDELGVKEDD